jgi:hypothetical protein
MRFSSYSSSPMNSCGSLLASPSASLRAGDGGTGGLGSAAASPRSPTTYMGSTGSPREALPGSPREGQTAHAQGRGNGRDGGSVAERMRQGSVISILPEGERGALADFKFYIRNNHVLLSAFVADQSHPSPEQRRRLALLNSLAFGFFLAALLLLAKSRRAADVPDLPAEARGLIALVRNWPITLSVGLQLVWDVGSASLGVCPCAKVGPVALRKPCGYGMLLCLACHVLGALYAAAGVILLLFFGPALSPASAADLCWLFLISKVLAWLLAVPVGALIFLALRQNELSEQAASRVPSYDEEGGGQRPPQKKDGPRKPALLNPHVGWKNNTSASVPGGASELW